MGMLKRGVALIAGVANDKSICWAIAKKAREEGAEVVLSYQNEALGKRVIPLAEGIGALNAIQCDFTKAEEVESLFANLKRLGRLRYAVHGIAYSRKEELRGSFLEVSDENFDITMKVSCGSFITMARHCAELMRTNPAEFDYRERGSIIGLTYMASHRPQPNYNIMSVAKAALESAMMNAASELGRSKIRVNLLSPSPEETLSARGVKGFQDIGRHAEEMSMLGRRVTLEEIANAAVFFLSERASGITAQTIMVDGGASVAGMPLSKPAPGPALQLVPKSDSTGSYLDHTGEEEIEPISGHVGG